MPDRREAIERFGVAELPAAGVGELEVARRQVVAGRVAEDVVGEVEVGVGGFGEVFEVAGRDEGEFAFVVEVRLGGLVDGD